MGADGTNSTQLTYDPGIDCSPAWSPDGTKIVFECSYWVNRDICIMNADGSDVTRITDHPALDMFPDWR